MAYEQITFSKLSKERKEKVRMMIPTLRERGLSSEQIAKRLRISAKSVATTLGNLNR